ncbi:Vps51/Vps67 domain-containing protein [Flagelloscypha sp. PMI_526]|nr:Vps51/Vps67 domain-containing protein [Flagelloscypha sp. PMI_526]
MTSRVVSSPGGASLNGSAILSNGSPGLLRKANPTHSGKLLQKQPIDASLDPEALFCQYTVIEVKAIENRLRADADAKQEELRIMVGERYRDLLQASTSIIDISDSSKRVIATLANTISSIQSQEAPSDTRRTSNQDEGVKLLLDAPEHLWRFIEGKKFLVASWLFQLSSVVHQALLNSIEEENDWADCGIDTVQQFPLIERQWDVVKQFRQQIVQKATIGLRDFDASPENTCATLLTLHLLDRKPLGDTFAAALQERARAMQGRLAWQPTESSQESGHVKETSKSSVFRRVPVRAIQDATISALSGIASTLLTLRTIFEENGESSPLIVRVLEFIQTGSTSSSLPEELRITTATLLSTLPSSSQLMMLPETLRAYKPHINATSLSTLSQTQFSHKLDGWLGKACQGLEVRLEDWFEELQSLREVWHIRTAVNRWLLSSKGLRVKELEQLRSLLEDACRQRVVAIWKTMLTEAKDNFEQELSSAVKDIRAGLEATTQDCSPVEFMFSTPSMPIASHSFSIVSDASFQKYQTALQKQLSGRSVMFDKVLNALETCARSLKQDLAFVESDTDSDEGVPAIQFNKVYRPEADTLCNGVAGILAGASEQAHYLSSHSSFILDLGCDDKTALDFRKRTLITFNQTIDRWREHTLAIVLPRHLNLARSSPVTETEPSHAMSCWLFDLGREVEMLALGRDARQREPIVARLVSEFISSLLAAEERLSSIDLATLKKLATIVCRDDTTVQQGLDERISQFERMSENTDSLVDAYLARTQLLLAGLLPYPNDSREKGLDTLGLLLPYGAPSTDQQYQPAFETSRSSRFGLLLVDTSIVR